MKVPDRNLHELREQGLTIVEGFLAQDGAESRRLVSEDVLTRAIRVRPGAETFSAARG